MYDLPSQQQEDANAAYVWLKCCQEELSETCKKGTLSSETHHRIEYAFKRYKMAYNRYLELGELVKPAS